MGNLSLQIPQTRDTEFCPSSLACGIRSERALKLALAEMYVQGVSTRKVAKITEGLRTSNVLERVNKEIKRRTRVATLFPNEASCLRRVTAVIMEISDDWETGKIYLTMTE